LELSLKKNKVFIIAEAGVNHNGSINLAKKLIDAAAFSGADAVKFQSFTANSLVSIGTPKAEYQKGKTDINESHFDMIKKLELDENSHKELISYCNKKNIIFLSTPFDISSVNLLNRLGLKIIKIPSGEITNLPYLRHIGSLNKKVILSTGMSNLQEVGDALMVLINAGTLKKNITVLHSNTMYPTPMKDVNLRAMQVIRDKFDVSIGYSDHTLGIEVDIAAVALGASVIEKHFTLDKKMEGPDHSTSLDSIELKSMVVAIRNIEKALGAAIKELTVSEKSNKSITRKSIVAKKNIKKGEFFSDKNLTTKRPGSGISPMEWDSIIGNKAERDYNSDELL
jgi:N,N'-diacetyllegionaminate synthase